ncbi:hypothetical protein [Actinomadura parmotrematis]|uniref:Uncharacterized protein n=1 Tax=Actinomadura parmotrematis TaxID=2864039 RepID=A0ABS7FYB5_9ACTN|nr:hypothetical protein [Actinomadura parmotrematis]MBW8485428.1 hypothetical protein [Actinomadura parmotrematis]
MTPYDRARDLAEVLGTGTERLERYAGRLEELVRELQATEAAAAWFGTSVTDLAARCRTAASRLRAAADRLPPAP